MSDAFDDKDDSDARIMFMVIGTVIDRNDPLNLGRIVARVPGMFEEGTAWAMPLGVGGGTRNNGLFFIPEVGADVSLSFNRGDPSEPYYLAANWGIPQEGPEVPSEAFPDGVGQSASPDNRVIAVPGFRIEINATEGQRKLRLTDQKTGNNITLDQETNTIIIRGITGITLSSDGEINLDAPMVTIAGRPVSVGVERPL